MNENADIIRRLERQRQQMVNYINLRLELEDWHGVRDAAADLETIDAQIRLLRLTVLADAGKRPSLAERRVALGLSSPSAAERQETLAENLEEFKPS